MNYKKLIYVLLGVLVFSSFRFLDTDNRFQYIFDKLAEYSENESPEKVYVHTDKDYYTNGETIWFKSYLIDGVTHKRSNKSNVIYVELINSKDSIVAKRTLYTDQIGAFGDIEIGKDWKEGNYLLRSYTHYMRNSNDPIFFHKEIPIWYQQVTSETINKPISKIKDTLPVNSSSFNNNEKPLLKLYPEGGNIVSGLKNTLGILATDSKGNGISLSGSIEDDNGKKVTFFRTYAYGLGKTTFIPEPNKNYTANVLVDNKVEKYPVPIPMDMGYRLSVRNFEEYVILDVNTNLKTGLQGSLLIGHLRGKVVFKHIEPEKKSSYSIKLLTDEFDDGVTHFTLFTPSGEAVCERLTFIDHPKNDVQLTIAPDKTVYGRREKISIDMLLADVSGNPLEGDFSMSVANRVGIKGLTKNRDIKTWLLLDSDLKGTIENPGYFFENDKKENRKYLLDALMLTKGWRRFVWKDFLQRTSDRKKEFPPEKGVFISGKTTVFEKPYATKQEMTKISFLGKDVYQEKKLNTKKGRFRFGPFVFKDSINTIIEATNPDETNEEKKKAFSIFVDAPISGPVIKCHQHRKSNSINEEIRQKYLATALQQKIVKFKYDSEITELDEVLLKTKKKTLAQKINREINQQTLYGSPSKRLFTDSIPGSEGASVIDLLRRVAGVRVFGSYPNQKVQIRGVSSFTLSTDPLYLLDGNEIPASVANGMLASEISFVDVLKGNDATVYGSRGSNGVVALYTYNGFGSLVVKRKFPGVINFTCPGFYQAREFFEPDYRTKKPDHIKPDYRTTLHWEPFINIEGQTKLPIDFYASDDIGVYTVNIEGITSDGRAIKSTFDISIEE